jgi:uncharacterized membrane protein
MTAQFWMGIAMGSMGAWAFLILIMLSQHRGRRMAKGLSDAANDLLRERNAIGEQQVDQLEDIAFSLRSINANLKWDKQ